MKNIIFGTDGIRTHVGTEPLTPHTLHHIGYAIGQWMCNQYTTPQLIIAHDTRASSAWVQSALKSGLLMHPITVHLGYTMATPLVSAVVEKHDNIQCGLVITASHNPPTDNGIKIITKEGKLSGKQEADLLHILKQEPAPKYTAWGNEQIITSAESLYRALLEEQLAPNTLAGLNVVLDCAHGATHRLAPELFNHFGASVHTIGTEPNGNNINLASGALYPQKLQQLVMQRKADLGFAFDGDGDRIIAVNNKGEIKDGDDIIALLHKHPNYQHEKIVVGTIMSNHALADTLAETDTQFIRTPVGDRHVIRALIENKALLGSEPSGHIIMRDHLNTSDGIRAALFVAEYARTTNNFSLKSFIKTPQCIINMPIKQKKDLSEMGITSVIAAHESSLDDGRIIVRYSGTENVLRIMVEDANADHAQRIASQLSQDLHQQLC